MQFYLAGLHLGVGGQGWTPYANVSVHSLTFRNGTTSETLTGVSPSVGAAYNTDTHGYSLGVGYTWVNKEIPNSLNTQQGGSNGMTASAGFHAKGAGDRPTMTQLLGNYNFGARYLWTRARVSAPVGYSATRPTRLGLEFVAQGGGKSGATSHSFSVGPTLEQRWTPNFSTTISGGAKFNGRAGTAASNNAAYINLEFAITP